VGQLGETAGQGEEGLQQARAAGGQLGAPVQRHHDPDEEAAFARRVQAYVGAAAAHLQQDRLVGVGRRRGGGLGAGGGDEAVVGAVEGELGGADALAQLLEPQRG